VQGSISAAFLLGIALAVVRSTAVRADHDVIAAHKDLAAGKALAAFISVHSGPSFQRNNIK
jgi:hypothetical protein